jgi:hypothetical protein
MALLGCWLLHIGGSTEKSLAWPVAERCDCQRSSCQSPFDFGLSCLCGGFLDSSCLRESRLPDRRASLGRGRHRARFAVATRTEPSAPRFRAELPRRTFARARIGADPGPRSHVAQLRVIGIILAVPWGSDDQFGAVQSCNCRHVRRQLPQLVCLFEYRQVVKDVGADFDRHNAQRLS